LTLVKIQGSFRLLIIKANLHAYFNFTKQKNMTANLSSTASCRTTINRQGISLHYDSQK